MCYPLYGHELNEKTTPIEAGLGFFVALEKPGFNGRAPMLEEKSKGPSRRCIAFRMTGKSAPPRPDYQIFLPGKNEPIGQVTSGTQSPSLGIGIGLGYVPSASSKAGSELEIEIRGNRFPAVVVPKPIYRK
jgi:aminomethyltransferase